MDLGGDDERADEMEVLQAIFPPDELTIIAAAPYYFRITLTCSGDATEDEDDAGMVCEATFTLPTGYPAALPLELTLECDQIPYPRLSEIIATLHVTFPVDGEMKVWEMCEWLKENAAKYGGVDSGGGGDSNHQSQDDEARPCGGFMREWCSFVSLYEQSYCKGDTRFVVMIKLARDRGLNITGMGIAGKPGGLVAEGEESDVVEFMRLMRTEFFETLNPRGRKLTTRLQDRWPLDEETERYDVAEIMLRRHQDVYRTADRTAGNIKKEKEVARLAAWEAKDAQVVAGWEKKQRERWQRTTKGDTYKKAEIQAQSSGCPIAMTLEEAQRLVDAGKPATCTVAGVYQHCGPVEPPPARAEIEAQRLFSDFTIFQGKDADVGNITGKQIKTYGQGSKEAGNLFRKLGREDGFDAMFTYRFS
eukprot:gene3636-6837_t